MPIQLETKEALKAKSLRSVPTITDPDRIYLQQDKLVPE